MLGKDPVVKEKPLVPGLGRAPNRGEAGGVAVGALEKALPNPLPPPNPPNPPPPNPLIGVVLAPFLSEANALEE